jgi:mannose-6-phosphate isomerase-like protein (cupin superfamily)
MSERNWHVAGEALRELLAAADEPYVTGMRQGTMRFLLFAPRGVDDQRPHTQDELYIVARGSGRFVRGAERVRFGPGDALFVPAGMEHRFEEMSDDFETWVVFCDTAPIESRQAPPVEER